MRPVVVLSVVALLPACDRAFDLSRPPIDAPTYTLLDIGCADGTREALGDIAAYPRIAGCGGAWDVPGVVPAQAPTCGRGAGNSTLNPLGAGCNVSDLCAAGWDVCESATAVRGAIAPETTCAALSFPPDELYITRVSGPGGARCGDGTNDVFGCGTIGLPADATTCGALTQETPNDCFEIRPLGWVCHEPGEAGNITKTDPDHGGGVLCCRTAP